MKILVACEESQAVTIEMRKLGHEAYSCDILPCSGGHPEWHLQRDVTGILNNGWDMIIAHPPCTYLSNAGARFLFPRGVLNEERYKKGLEAKELFMAIWNCDCKNVVIENPIPSKIYGLPPYTQTIQPYEYGHPFKKKTCLWIKEGLRPLVPTDIVPIEEVQSTKVAGNWFNKGGKNRQKNRSKTFPGIAKAMAEQWAGGASNMNKVQIESYLAEHCVKIDVARLVAESTANWRVGLGKKKLQQDGSPS